MGVEESLIELLKEGVISPDQYLDIQQMPAQEQIAAMKQLIDNEIGNSTI